MPRASQTVDLVNRSSTPLISWICYRCNLAFHDESSVSLHNEITKHSARKIEFPQGRKVQNLSLTVPSNPQWKKPNHYKFFERIKR